MSHATLRSKTENTRQQVSNKLGQEIENAVKDYRNTCLDQLQVTKSWLGLKGTCSKGSVVHKQWERGSSICETHYCIIDITTRAQGHFVKLQIMIFYFCLCLFMLANQHFYNQGCTERQRVLWVLNKSWKHILLLNTENIYNTSVMKRYQINSMRWEWTYRSLAVEEFLEGPLGERSKSESER